MTPERIAEIAARNAARRAGPWTALDGRYGWHIGPQPDGVCTITRNTDGVGVDVQAANALFIANAPADITELLAYVNYLEDINARIVTDRIAESEVAELAVQRERARVAAVVAELKSAACYWEEKRAASYSPDKRTMCGENARCYSHAARIVESRLLEAPP